MNLFSCILLGAILFWLVAIFYSLQKGLNQIIRGLNSIDERLAKSANTQERRG